MLPISSTTIVSKGKEIKIHAISTGEVKVKTKFRSATQTGKLATLHFVLDSEFTEWLPIWTWVIEHPEGIFVVDTGINANINDAGYFKAAGLLNSWANTSLFQYRMSKEEEIDKQLATLNIATKDVKQVIMTHMHIDHFDGLRFFENSEIIIHKKEWTDNTEALPDLYPEWLKPSLVNLHSVVGAFKQSYTITKAADLHLVFTPGHTVGHCSVLLEGDKADILFAGDITYYEEQLTTEEYSGSIQDAVGNKNTYKTVLAHSKTKPLVFLPTHDKESAKRLINHTVLRG
jgi:N-acyl homoserine lactone hydrolase